MKYKQNQLGHKNWIELYISGCSQSLWSIEGKAIIHGVRYIDYISLMLNIYRFWCPIHSRFVCTIYKVHIKVCLSWHMDLDSLLMSVQYILKILSCLWSRFLTLRISELFNNVHTVILHIWTKEFCSKSLEFVLILYQDQWCPVHVFLLFPCYF